MSPLYPNKRHAPAGDVPLGERQPVTIGFTTNPYPNPVGPGQILVVGADGNYTWADNNMTHEDDILDDSGNPMYTLAGTRVSTPWSTENVTLEDGQVVQLRSRGYNIVRGGSYPGVLW